MSGRFSSGWPGSETASDRRSRAVDTGAVREAEKAANRDAFMVPPPESCPKYARLEALVRAVVRLLN